MNNLLPKCSRLALALGALMLIACSPAAMSVQPVTADSANATRAATSPLVTPDSATATRATSATAPIATRVQTAPADSGANAPSPASVGYAIVDTGQGKCYNNSQETTCPQPVQPFY